MTEALTPATVKRLRELERAATPGPWEYWEHRDVNFKGEHLHGVTGEAFHGGNQTVFASADDSRFIAEFRNAVPALLDEVERLQERVRRLKEALVRFVNGMEMGGLIGCSEDWQSEISQAKAAFEKDMD